MEDFYDNLYEINDLISQLTRHSGSNLYDAAGQILINDFKTKQTSSSIEVILEFLHTYSTMLEQKEDNEMLLKTYLKALQFITHVTCLDKKQTIQIDEDN